MSIDRKYSSDAVLKLPKKALVFQGPLQKFTARTRHHMKEAMPKPEMTFCGSSHDLCASSHLNDPTKAQGPKRKNHAGQLQAPRSDTMCNRCRRGSDFLSRLTVPIA